MMKRILTICLCAAMLLSFALAEDSVNLGSEGCDHLKHVCTLPDGRLVFCGNRGVVGNYNDSRARLVCLNPDWSVSWEYFDPAEGMGRYAFGALLDDGTIGIIYYNAPYQVTQALEIRKFTLEGKPVGEPVDLIHRSDNIPSDVSSQWLIQMIDSDNGPVRSFISWDGEILFSIPARQSVWPLKILDTGDGIVLAGSESVSNGFAKIMKMDRQGRILWETVLPLMNSYSSAARIQNCIRTSDGGYLGWIMETTPEYGRQSYALVRFSENGRVLWTNRGSFADRENIMCQDLIEYDGKYVLLETPDFSDMSEKAPRVFHWFDANGNKLGETSLRIPREDARGVTDRDILGIYGGDMLIREDGLWVLYDIQIMNDQDVRKEMDSQDPIVFRVPELPE